MFRGRITFATPMLWMMGFIFTFTIGGMTGVMLSIPGVDFQLHNSLFLIAHFHNTIIGGVVFGYFAGLVYWFPKFFGFTLNEKFGKLAFWHWIIGFFVTFTPLYILGFMGMTRRLQHISDKEWQPLLIIAGIGTAIIAVGVVMQAVQLIVSIKHRTKNKDTTGDPWDGRTLEWSTSSPPPHYNFAIIPTVHGRHAFWDIKYGEGVLEKPLYQDIHMPKNTAFGFYIALACFFFGFGLVWHMFWLSLFAILGVVVCVIVRSLDDDIEYIVKAEDIQRIENKRTML
jgi:cytochrome o ubiquinol oxidase subunit 1